MQARIKLYLLEALTGQLYLNKKMSQNSKVQCNPFKTV